MDDNAKVETIDQYIDQFPDDVQAILQQIRRLIQEAAPDAEETISYRIPTFKLNGALVHFAAYRKHIGFYPTPAGIQAFADRLSAYEGAKGSVKFPLDRPIPYDLIRDIVLYRVAQNTTDRNAGD
jgi:uncharacterized protein YdhG (YjbR/CyaY superfamily)